MRIRPIDIEVPEDDPFVHDRLDRGDQAKALEEILKIVKGPFTLAVDAPWGEGKTTFLRMSQVHLRQEEFLVVDFNAWETDFSDDPFIALTTEIIEQIESIIRQGKETSRGERFVRDIQEAIDSLRERSTSVAISRLITAGTKLLSLATLGIDLSGFVEANSITNERIAELKFKAYSEQKDLMKRFVKILSKLGILAKQHTNRPLVVVIDELDRCRPTYAIELLETIKHLFSVDGVVFVLGLNRSELAHSVRAVYGDRFGAEKYLSRLIDIDLNLPRPDIARFVDSTIEYCDIATSLATNQTRNVRYEYDDAKSVIKKLLASSELSIRDIAQAIHHLGLVLASLPPRFYPLMQLTVVLLVLRSLDRSLYNLFVRGEATDTKVVNSLFDRPGLSRLAKTNEGAYIEVYIVQAYREILHGNDAWNHSTPYLDDCNRLLEESNAATSEVKEHAMRIVERVKRGTGMIEGRVYTKVVISRIEMFARSITEQG